jgi:hypothetical protein
VRKNGPAGVWAGGQPAGSANNRFFGPFFPKKRTGPGGLSALLAYFEKRQLFKAFEPPAYSFPLFGKMRNQKPVRYSQTIEGCRSIQAAPRLFPKKVRLSYEPMSVKKQRLELKSI